MILDNEDIHDEIIESFKNYAHALVYDHLIETSELTETDINEIVESFNGLAKKDIKVADIQNKTADEVYDYISNYLITEYQAKIKDVPAEIIREFEKAISLRIIDTHWMEHINTMALLREGIGLRGYAQENPLRAYTNEGFELFENLLDLIDKQITTYLIRAEVRQNVERKQVAKGEAVNDPNKVKKKAPKRVAKIGRNDQCPCGSGRKYKQCCGK